jgi:adenylyltransferase/sulfurtransferase
MAENQGIPEITPTELKERLDRGDALAIIDVREPFEWEIGNLEPYGARLIPLAQVPHRMDEIDRSEEIVLQCRSGARSANALQFLRAHGYERLWNLEGGILAWSDEVDPSIPRY